MGTHDGSQSRESASSASATFISLVALVVSIFSAHQSCSLNQDMAKAQAIRESYTTFEELTRLQLENWQLSHMFALPDHYDAVVNQVSTSSGALEPAKRQELLLKERALADIIFNAFEQNYYQWRHAKEVSDIKRVAFLEEVLNYLTGRLLRNPRLLYYWADAGLSASYESTTREFYDYRVLNNPRQPLTHSADSKGPFSTNP